MGDVTTHQIHVGDNTTKVTPIQRSEYGHDREQIYQVPFCAFSFPTKRRPRRQTNDGIANKRLPGHTHTHMEISFSPSHRLIAQEQKKRRKKEESERFAEPPLSSFVATGREHSQTIANEGASAQITLPHLPRLTRLQTMRAKLDNAGGSYPRGVHCRHRKTKE